MAFAGPVPPQYSQEAYHRTGQWVPAQRSQVLGASTSAGGQSGAGPQNPLDGINIPSPDTPFGGGGSEIDVINQQFDAFNSVLGEQESRAQSNFNETKGLYDTQKASAEKQYTTEKSQQTEQTKKTESLNLKKVRQLLGELSQRNAAQTAITGGGSISEVLAERFGKEAQSRLGNVMDTAQQSIQRVNTFYDNAITKLNDSYQANIVQAKQGLEDNLAQIRSARQQSAAAKQQGVLSAWKDYYNNVNQAKAQAATFKAQYDLWKDQQDQSLAATQDFNLNNQGQFNQGIGQSFSPLPQASTGQQQQSSNFNPLFRINDQGDLEDKYLQQQQGIYQNAQ